MQGGVHGSRGWGCLVIGVKKRRGKGNEISCFSDVSTFLRFEDSKRMGGLMYLWVGKERIKKWNEIILNQSLSSCKTVDFGIVTFVTLRMGSLMNEYEDGERTD